MSATSATADRPAHVEIDLFSGRPNPSFVLDAAGTSELLRLVAGATKAARAVAPREGLGFRGFVVSVEGGPQLFVSGPAISIGSEQLLDETQSIEKFLLSRIPADQRRELGAALARP